jgi:hypothetical protein
MHYKKRREIQKMLAIVKLILPEENYHNNYASWKIAQILRFEQ